MGDAYCVDYSCRPVDNNSQQHTYYPDAWDIHNNLAFSNSPSHISLLGAGAGMDERMITPYNFGGYDSSGYLEDVLQLLHYGNSSTKRRKLLLYTTPPHQNSTSLNDTSTHIITNNGPSLSTCSWESIRSRKSGVTVDQESMIFPSPEQANYNWPLEDAFSSSVVKDIHNMSPPKYGTTTTTFDDEDKSSHFSMPNCQENNNEERRMKKKMRSTKRSLVYPFALVKPGGEEGDVTLNDINQRLLMPPTRPIPHPVGDFAGHPWVSKPHGPGLSGKAVVALTTIRTLGRGTITIIRTKA